MLRPKDLAQRADDEIIRTADLFVVSWFIGRSPETYDLKNRKPINRDDLWIRQEFATLAEARAAQAARGHDRYGHRGVIYAYSTAKDLSVFVDDEYTKRVRPKYHRPEGVV